ncbi:hypothetical protein CH063_03213 [Colletotrichum higginsianum]|uniref:Secreted protein n=1 Tax=Colletotrichum higginsianum (strain IMI 349063) TaxID=759273 RepID=H1VUV4_COLHI|nr:hypothetical protein CH063_03213 [Colletotrichum higginsianum]
MTLAIAFALAAAARCRSTQCQQEKRRGETLQCQQHNQCAQPEKDLSTRHETMHARDPASRRQTAFSTTKLGTIDKCSTGQNVQNEVGDATTREELLDKQKKTKKKKKKRKKREKSSCNFVRTKWAVHAFKRQWPPRRAIPGWPHDLFLATPSQPLGSSCPGRRVLSPDRGAPSFRHLWRSSASSPISYLTCGPLSLSSPARW